MEWRLAVPEAEMAPKASLGCGLSDFKIVDDWLQPVGRDFEACKRDR